MNLKLFYSPPKWFAFVPPEKPVEPPQYIDFTHPEEGLRQFEFGGDIFGYERKLKKYNEAYAEAKANALEVGNPRDFQDDDFKTSMLLVDGKPFLADGQEYTWKGSAVIKDGKYILSI